MTSGLGRLARTTRPPNRVAPVALDLRLFDEPVAARLAADEFDRLWAELGRLAKARAGIATPAAVEPLASPPAAAPTPARGRPVRPLESVKVPCDPGCGLLVDQGDIGAHRRSCEAVLAYKAERGVRVIPDPDGPAPLPTPTVSREELEARRLAASRAAIDDTWRRTHPEDERPSSPPRTAPAPIRGRQWTQEMRDRHAAAMRASHARRRARQEASA